MGAEAEAEGLLGGRAAGRAAGAAGPRRRSVLGAFCLNQGLSALVWLTFAPAASEAAARFGTSARGIDLLSLMFMLMYVPASAACAASVQRFGLRACVVGASAGNFLACVLRAAACWLPPGPRAYGLLLAGQTLAAAVQPAFTNTPPRVAAAWFRDTAAATAVAALSNCVGMAVGNAAVPAAVLAPGGGWEPLLLGETAGAAAIMLATLLCFRSEPEVPPSAAEAARRAAPVPAPEARAARLRADVAALLADRQYMLLLVAFGSGLGMMNSVLTVIEAWVGTAGYETDAAGSFGAAFIVGGLVAAAVAAPALDRTRDYCGAVRVTFGVAALAAVGLVGALRPGRPGALRVAYALLGASVLPLMPIVFDAVAARTYPIPEDLSTGGLMAAGQLWGILYILVMGWLLELRPRGTGFGAPVNLVFVGVMACSALGAAFFRGGDQRAKAAATGGAAGEGGGTHEGGGGAVKMAPNS